MDAGPACDSEDLTDGSLSAYDCDAEGEEGWNDVYSESSDDEMEGIHKPGLMNLKFQLDTAKAGRGHGSCWHATWLSIAARNCINEANLDNICAFNLHISQGMSNTHYKKLWHSFPHKITLTSRWHARKQIVMLSGMKPGRVNRCPGSCCCFTASYARLDACPYCRKSRYKNDGVPVKQFQYLPVKNQLQMMLKDKSLTKQLAYQHASDTSYDSDIIQDIFNCSIYQELLEKQVIVDGKTQDHKYFSNPRDIALGISLDGVTYFNHCQHSVWPVILINYNLPPTTCTHRGNIICYGIIPGTVKNLDSYLVPLHDELGELAKGILTLDPWEEGLFWQHVYLILGFGDYPGIMKLIRMKGHNGLHLCQFCEILTVCVEGGNTHYVLLY